MPLPDAAGRKGANKGDHVTSERRTPTRKGPAEAGTIARLTASMALAMVFALVSVLTAAVVDPGASASAFAGPTVSAPVVEAKTARPVASAVKDPVRILASHRAGNSKYLFDGVGPALAPSALRLAAPVADRDRGLPPRDALVSPRRHPAHPVRAPPLAETRLSPLPA